MLTAQELIDQALRESKHGEEVSRRLVPPQDADTVAYITVRLHAPGTISVQGHVGDKRMALQLLEHGRDAISRQFVDDRQVVVPSRDVEVTPSMPLKEMGDLLPHERGDG
jgi:anion-transporting  ArsA/GET3 family ATPase